MVPLIDGMRNLEARAELLESLWLTDRMLAKLYKLFSVEIFET